MKLEFSQHIFKKSSNIIFNENPSSGSRLVDGRTDRQTDTMKLTVAFLQFCETRLETGNARAISK
jgi:hypothetical protein